MPVLGERRAVFIVLLFCFCLPVFTSGIVFASSGNWVEVTRFTGTIWGGSTEPFTCDHIEWRIRWSYEPTPSDLSVMPIRFRFNVVESGGELVKFFIPNTGSLSGTLYVNQTGEFYLYIDTIYTENYTIIVEQNLDSIPEFPSWIILPLTMTATLIAAVLKRRRL